MASCATCIIMGHMKTISIRELHERTGAWVRRAAELGAITVTERGRPIARLEAVEGPGRRNPFLARKLRPGYKRLLGKLKAGAMPPAEMPRPAGADVKAVTVWIEREFERADRLVKPDPGRVTAHRLNRSEYSNTVRDLLDVNFRADKEFPTDDSGSADRPI